MYLPMRSLGTGDTSRSQPDDPFGMAQILSARQTARRSPEYDELRSSAAERDRARSSQLVMVRVKRTFAEGHS